MKIAFFVSGTGGHIYPALLTAMELKKKAEICFFIPDRKLAKQLVGKEGFKFEKVRFGPLNRKFSIKVLKYLIEVFNAILKCYFKLKKFKPDIVVGFGSYMSLIGGICSVLSGVPLYLHEQNIKPGLANRICSYFAKKIFISFKESYDFFKSSNVLLTGNPVRIAKKEKSEIYNKCGLSMQKFTLLCYGGSQGARSLITAIVSLLPEILESWQVVLVTGKANYEFAQQSIKNLKFVCALKIFEYIDNLVELLKEADLVVCRAGAATIAELLFYKKKAIIIPYPAASDNHQVENAKVAENIGIGTIIKDDENLSRNLKKYLLDFMNNPDKIKEKNYEQKSKDGILPQKKMAELILMESGNASKR